MANYRYEWDKMFPEGFVTYATRHMPKNLHSEIEILATLLKESVEMVMIRALQAGKDALRAELKALAEANGVKDNQIG